MVKSFKTNILTWLKTKTYIKTEIDELLQLKSNIGHTHTNASTTTPGFLSAEDKTKLNNLEQITVDSSINATSTNPVQNKVINTALTGKANTNHTHSITNITNLQSQLDGKANSVHTHDDRYYTETEMNTKLNGKANSSHTHSITNITNLQSQLDGKANSVHTHDDRYYTETEMNTKLNGKANSSHTHTASQISDLTVSTHTLANGAKLYKYGKIVLAVFNNYQYSGKKPYVWTDIFNIPSAYKPISTDNIYGHMSGSNGQIVAGSNKISMYPPQSSGGVFGHILWITS